MRISLIILYMCAALTACAGYSPVDEPRQRTAYTGEQIYQRACSACHGRPSPSRHTADEWPAVVTRMRENIRKANMIDLTDAQADSVTTYLQDAALGRTDPNSPILTGSMSGQQLFEKTCSRCHALPLASRYPPGDWPAVVERMRRNMRTREISGITDQQANRIVQYLQAASEGSIRGY
jgi:mono/diheme cytochrome c family protein